MRLRSGKIVGLCCLCVRVLRSGREMLTVPTKKVSPKTNPVVNRVRFSTESWFNEREGGFIGNYKDAFSFTYTREKQAYERWQRWFRTVLDYCRYMDG